jgi:hypothetical protein
MSKLYDLNIGLKQGTSDSNLDFNSLKNHVENHFNQHGSELVKSEFHPKDPQNEHDEDTGVFTIKSDLQPNEQGLNPVIRKLASETGQIAIPYKDKETSKGQMISPDQAGIASQPWGSYNDAYFKNPNGSTMSQSGEHTKLPLDPDKHLPIKEAINDYESLVASRMNKNSYMF